MGNVIRMDFYRLRRSLSFKICIITVLAFNLINGPLEKLIFNISKALVKNDPEALEKLGEYNNVYHLGNNIASPLNSFCLVIFMLCIVWFCYADLQHGFIKNIAGQLPSRGHTVISKFIVIMVVTLIFMIAACAGDTIGHLIIGDSLHTDLVYYGLDGDPDKVFTMGEACIEFAVKWVLGVGVCCIILLFTTGFSSNVAGTIIAVVCGGGLTSAVYLGISTGINSIFGLEGTKKIAVGDYMPDSLLHSNLTEDGAITTAASVGAATVFVLLYCTVKLFNKKDVK